MDTKDNTNTTTNQSLKEIVQVENANSEKTKKSEIDLLKERLKSCKEQINSMQHKLNIRRNIIILLSILFVCLFIFIGYMYLYYIGQGKPLFEDTFTTTTSTAQNLSEQDSLLIKANNNDINAIYLIASYYLQGSHGYAKDTTKSLEWLTRSANLGHTPSMVNIANMYQKAQGTPKDDKLAFRYYFLAAQNGDGQSLYEVGQYYLKGIVVEKNIDKAITYLRQSAQKGNSSAKSLLGQVSQESITQPISNSTKAPITTVKKPINQNSYSNLNNKTHTNSTNDTNTAKKTLTTSEE